MASCDDLLATIDAVHAAGFEPERWPQALSGMADVIGGAAATIEAFAKHPLRPRGFYFHGVPPAIEMKYLDHYAKLNRRLTIAAHDPVGRIAWDYRMFDERTIEHDPFYMEFLASYGLRYFVSGIIVANREEFAGVCVHRSPRQGHIDKPGVELMERLLPHVRAAFDVTRRFRGASDARQALERALDWLADGVVLVRANRVVYVNRAFEAIARRGDGVRLRNAQIELTDARARYRLAAALDAANRLRNVETRAAISDFAVVRPSGAPAYFVSVRPLPAGRRDRMETAADAVVFVRDPCGRSAAAGGVLREVFGLTEAEANLAEALQTGVLLRDYAETRAVSLNTVYTHLRGIKRKTGCRRLPELIRKLNDLLTAVRSE